MAKLILSLDNVYLSEYLLNKVRTSIGRRPSSDLYLDNLAVSGEHAVIVKQENDYYVTDLGSTNGTLVNGEIITSHLLQHADVIELGKFQLKYLNDSFSEGASVDNVAPAFEKTMMMRSSKMKSKPAAVPAPEQLSAIKDFPDPVTKSSLVDAPIEMVGKIQVLNGSGSGRELVLNKALTTLGKVGVQVAVITRRSNGYFITHVEGKVMPKVNGIPTGPQAYLLRAHDVIELAGVKMEFYLTNF